MRRGREVPLALRLFLESVLSVPIDTRNNAPVAMHVTLRELLKWLYPGKRRPKPNEYWPRLMRAVQAIDDSRIPWHDPETGHGGSRRIVSVSDIP